MTMHNYSNITSPASNMSPQEETDNTRISFLEVGKYDTDD